MDQQSNNLHAGYAHGTYPLARLLKALPSLAGLQAFVAAAHWGSLSKAADQLCRTQGALSRQIQQLEAHYGNALFTRSAAGLTLTRQGEALRGTALQVLSQLVELEHALLASAPMLALRAPSTFGIRWLLPRLQAIRAALAGTELRVITSSSDTPDFSDPDIDAIIVRGTGNWPGLESVFLFHEKLTPLCAPGLAPSLRSAGHLKSATLLHPGVGGAEWKCWLQQTGHSDIDVLRGLVFDTLDLTLTAAAQGHGVAIGDPRMAAERLERGELVMPFPQQVENGAAYYLTLPSQRTETPSIRALADVLVRLVAEDAQSSKVD